MTRKKLSTWILIALVLLILPFKQAAAQESPFVEEIFPQQGSLGTVIEMLVRGGGFESVQALNGVLLNGQEIPVLDWAILSDDVVKIQLLIPENVRVGETEIRFVFDDIPMDALFIVTDRENVPFIQEFSPQEGQIDTEVPLSFAVRNYDLGSFGGITIGYEEIPVNQLSVSDSGEAWEFLVYLPTYLPPGDSVINLYFQNYTFSNYFYVYTPDGEEPLAPSIYGYDPNEAQVDTDIEFTLEGYVLPELGGLQAILIGDIELPIYYYDLNSDETAVAGSYLPPEIPPGENRIIFYFENYRYADTFYAYAPDNDLLSMPVLRSISPKAADPDSDISLTLSGENLDNLGEIIGVRIGQFFLPISDYYVESSTRAVVELTIPEDVPQGNQIITVSFENAEISNPFFISTIDNGGWPSWVLLIGGIALLGFVGVVGGGILVIRAVRKGKTPREKTRDEPRKPRADVQFKVTVDHGTQTVKPGGHSLTGKLDIRFEVSGDPGEQHIETEDDSLIADDE